MTPGDVYYARATEFLGSAEHVTDIEEREALHKLAASWFEISERASEYSRHSPDRIAG